MLREYIKHPSLISVREMKKAVSGQYPMEWSTECQRLHIADDPFLIRQPTSAQRYECLGAVYPGDLKTLATHMMGNGGRTPTAKIKNSRARRKETEESFDKGFICPNDGAAVDVPRHRMALVMALN